MSLDWKGDALKGKILNAAIWGIDKTMSESVIEAKQSHPGWNNVTGLAEGSVRIQDFAQKRPRGAFGRWGSTGVNYVIHLEYKRGSFLRTAGDKQYPSLARHIRSRLDG